MKRLYLLRHGKSDWDAGPGVDHDRPLAPRGRQAACAVGRLLARIGQVPDRVLTSSAVRARTTVELAAAEGRWERRIEVAPELYGAGPGAILERLKGTDDEAVSVLVAGHEPTMSSTAGGLVGGAALRMVTAALARIDLGIESWRQVDFGVGQLAWLVTPKLLPGAER